MSAAYSTLQCGLRAICRGAGFLSLITVFGSPLAQPLRAEEQGLTPSVAEALVKAKVKSVVVFDFLGPGEKLTQLGRNLADTFSHSLEKSAVGVTVLDRSQVSDVLDKNRVVPTIVRDSELAWWLARQLQAESLILGSLSPSNGGKVQLTISIGTMQKGKALDTLSVEIPLTSEMSDHFNKTLWNTARTPAVQPGTTIGRLANCRACPPPRYPIVAQEQMQQGPVRLSGLVGVDGQMRDIDYVDALSYGLTQQAIAAARTWEFNPGQNVQGKPIEMRINIVVMFTLLK